MAGSNGAPWAGSFQIEGDPSGHIVLKQVDGKSFELASTILYLGEETGLENVLEPAVVDALRWVSPERLRETDLASVPLPLRWLVSTYGVHTPAALIHDWMIDEGPPVIGGLTPQYADRYFRFMLSDLGVRWLRRWMMWAAVALRTRWKTGPRRRALLVVWMIAAIAGIAGFGAGLVIGRPSMVIVATVAPLGFALLWGRQYGAGLVAAYNAPWVLPPTIIGMAGYGVYVVIEGLVSRLSPTGVADEPYGLTDF
jgi:hypothetical protein